MAELQSVKRMLGSLPGNQLTQYPSGRWGFIGSVSVELIYRRLDSQPLTDQDCQDIRQVGAGMLRHRIESISYATQAEAEQAARDLGQQPSNR